MIKKINLSLISLLIMGLTMNAFAENNPLIQNIQGRNSITLNGKWNYIIDPYETGY